MFTLLVEQHLFQKALEYADGTIDLQELETWLLPNLETILDGGDVDSIALAKLIEGGAIELQAGISSRGAFCQELKKLLSSVKLDQPIIWFGNTAGSKENIWDAIILDQPQTVRWDLQFA